MENCINKCLTKMTVRNFITIATISVFLGIVVFIVGFDQGIIENPVIMFILGAFMSAVTMIYTFYYRKNPAQHKPIDSFKDDDFNECPLCGSDIS